MQAAILSNLPPRVALQAESSTESSFGECLRMLVQNLVSQLLAATENQSQLIVILTFLFMLLPPTHVMTSPLRLVAWNGSGVLLTELN